MIAIIDYGAGNLASVKNALSRLGFPAAITADEQEILEADKVILPGVGAFADAINAIRAKRLHTVIQEVVRREKPLLGICLGMQLLFTESEENGSHQGLDIIKGRVVRFQIPQNFKVPHMGWNAITPRVDSRLFQNIPDGSNFYFVHSYYVIPQDFNISAASCNYGVDFTCALEWQNIFATQFHPEKSSTMGLKVLQNFGEI